MATELQKQQRLIDAGWEHTDNGWWWLPGRAGCGMRLDEAYQYLCGKESSEIVTAYNAAGDVCWMCELCAMTVPCADGDPLPEGWRMGYTPQGPGPICANCCSKEEKG
jgi:hypothetical protein